MPPKRQRGGAGAGAGAARKDSQEHGENTQPSKSTTRGALTSENPVSSLLYSGDLESSDLAMTSPNSSPASPPTETPAPTPIRAPVQRLESLANRAGPSASRGSSLMGKFKPRGIRRDKDERERAEREEQARLDARAADERDILMAEGDTGRSKRGSFGAIGARGDRGRGRGRGGRGVGRGRGDAMGGGELDSGVSRTASGPFGVAPETSDKKKKKKFEELPTADVTRGERALESDDDIESTTRKKPKIALTAPTTTVQSSSDSTTIKLEPESIQDQSQTPTVPGAAATAISSIKSEPNEPIYPEEQEEGGTWARRVNIEHINLVSEDEDGEVQDMSQLNIKKEPPNKAGLRPVRLERVEHKQRITIVSTESAAAPSLESDSENGDGMFVEQDDAAENQRRQRIDFLRDGKRWPGVWRDENDAETRIKAEPGVLSTGFVAVGDKLEALSTNQSAGAKEGNRRARIVASNVESGTSATANFEDMTAIKVVERQEVNCEVTESRLIPGKERRKRVSASSSGNEDYESIFQTEEDKAEFERYRRDRSLLVKELGHVPGEQEWGSVDEDQMDVDGESQLAEGIERICLFQFPPVLPPLRNPAKRADIDLDLDMTESDTKPSAVEPPIDLTADDAVVIKTEPGQSNAIQLPSELVGDDGFIGRLVVRKSGLVELNWGGTVLRLGRAAESGCLSIVMSVDMEENDESTSLENEAVEVYGTATGLVASKYIATPAWDNLFAGTALAECNEEMDDE